MTATWGSLSTCARFPAPTPTAGPCRTWRWRLTAPCGTSCYRRRTGGMHKSQVARHTSVAAPTDGEATDEIVMPGTAHGLGPTLTARVCLGIRPGRVAERRRRIPRKLLELRGLAQVRRTCPLLGLHRPELSRIECKVWPDPPQRVPTHNHQSEMLRHVRRAELPAGVLRNTTQSSPH